MNYLLDTCVISELVKKKPSPNVVRWLGGCDEQTLYLSVLTLGELGKGVAKLPGSRRRNELHRWLSRDLVERFGNRTLVVDERVAAEWGTISGASEAKGASLPVIDSLIAATARVHDLVVATRNVEDIKRCGARFMNPWDAPAG